MKRLQDLSLVLEALSELDPEAQVADGDEHALVVWSKEMQFHPVNLSQEVLRIMLVNNWTYDYNDNEHNYKFDV